jgi:hypothetical protein
LLIRYQRSRRPLSYFGDDPDTKVDTDKCKVEILAEGSQFVGFGIHPDTKAPYRWPYKSPLDVPFADVPLVTPEKLQQFVAESEAMLRAAGARTIAEIKKAKKATEKESKEREATAEKETEKVKKAAEKETKERAATVEKETEKLEKQGYAGTSGGDFFKQVPEVKKERSSWSRPIGSRLGRFSATSKECCRSRYWPA